jgi:Fe-S oxidoreductase
MIELGLNLDDYQYDARHYPAQGHGRWIDYNYVQGVDFSWRCPSWQYHNFDAYGIAGKCDIVDYLLRGKLDYASPTLRDIVFSDPLCGSCDVAGKRNLDFEFQLMLESLRVRLVEKGYGMPQHLPMTDCILKSGNRFGRSQSERNSWLPKDIKSQAKADTLYFAGCRAAMSDTAISQSTAKIMAAANVPFSLLDDEPCCGHFVFITGQLAKAKKIAEENMKRIRQTGAKTVVFSCAECYKTFKVDYPKMLGFATSDLGFEVKHITELADQWQSEGSLKLNNSLDMKVTYHDPCNLGRLSEPWLPWAGKRGEWGVFEPPRTLRRGIHGVYEPPRNLLRAIKGLTLAEMVRHHENAFCSGSDGGVREAFPDFACWAADERMREAASTGAEAVVSACPGCKASFAEASSSMKSYDITELVAKAIS